MKGVIVHVNEENTAAVIACETEDYMVVDFKKPGRIHHGDQVDTQGLWFGEHGKMADQTSNHQVEVEVQCIVRDLATAERECDEA
jgi:hypothetical protein